MSRFFVVEPCNSSGGFEVKLREGRFDLSRCEIALSKIGSVAGNTGIVLLAKVDDFTLSIYGSGRIMVKGKGKGTKKPARAEMEGLASKLMSALENEGAVIG
jgi:hypothetical protein